MTDFHLNVCTYEELARYRRYDAVAGNATFRSTSGKFVATRPRAEPRELLAALVGSNDTAFAEHRPQSLDVVFLEDGAFLHASIGRRGVSISILAPDLEAPKRVEAVAARLGLFVLGEPEESGVWATFANLTERGVDRHTRFVGCPKLGDIRDNYPARTFEELDSLAADPAPWTLGKLVIWSGPPGTGKTYALRALMHAWQGLFDVIVINDPERFAGEPSYYFDVVGYGESSYAGEPTGDERSGPSSSEPSPSRPKLIVMEDAADLILLESRSRHFDKLGKLLNLTDGLFGQGRNDLFLVTFNEDISEIDPAFLRPGRCRAKVEFPSLSREEGAEWLSRHGVPFNPRQELTLAGLYRKLHEARKSGRKVLNHVPD